MISIKKTIGLIAFLMTSTVISMERGIQDMPAEILEKILCSNLYENIRKMDLDNIQNIFDFYNQLDLNLTQENFNILFNFRATCKYFSKFYPDYVKKFKEKFEQLKEDAIKDYKHLNKEQLNQMLESELNDYNPDLEGYCKLVLAGANINIKDNCGNTALIDAVYNNAIKTAKLLLLRGANVNVCVSKGLTALIIAADHGYTEIVRLLLLKHANVNNADKNGNTALIRAARNGHVDIVELLLEQADINVDAQNFCGNTALIWAIKNGHYEVVKLLLNNRDCNTALAVARNKGYLDIIKLIKKD